jgi:hypothetical protein
MMITKKKKNTHLHDDTEIVPIFIHMVNVFTVRVGVKVRVRVRVGVWSWG